MKLKDEIDRYKNIYIIAVDDKTDSLLEKHGPYPFELPERTIRGIITKLGNKLRSGSKSFYVLRSGNASNDMIRKRYGIPYCGETCMDVIRSTEV